MKTYVANWEVRGLPSSPILRAGESAQLEDTVAEPLVRCGAIMQLVELPIEQPPVELDLDTATKAQIIAYAEARYGRILSQSKTKNELLLAIAEAAEAAGD